MKSKGNSSIIIIWVLIDTWWNVNIVISSVITASVRVLIDTWWNVNILAEEYWSARLSFNRYMVECKFK